MPTFIITSITATTININITTTTTIIIIIILIIIIIIIITTKITILIIINIVIIKIIIIIIIINVMLFIMLMAFAHEEGKHYLYSLPLYSVKNLQDLTYSIRQNMPTIKESVVFSVKFRCRYQTMIALANKSRHPSYDRLILEITSITLGGHDLNHFIDFEIKIIF
ncbi:hypothetical protein ElyMa_001061100 [Elysia marginata]|uniref:Uncharacterized protein n=1 Tax=Elysia marginata TaxID=1093978 RepID=A0AAV4HRK0_9GAST|nr:hypothetical protein ElyMa_001061100 [Elysia marginata]